LNTPCSRDFSLVIRISISILYSISRTSLFFSWIIHRRIHLLYFSYTSSVYSYLRSISTAGMRPVYFNALIHHLREISCWIIRIRISILYSISRTIHRYSSLILLLFILRLFLPSVYFDGGGATCLF
jgi:hypothetical protein